MSGAIISRNPLLSNDALNDGEYAVKFLHSIGKTNATRERLLFPIPQTERDANPLMGQNPGY